MSDAKVDLLSGQYHSSPLEHLHMNIGAGLPGVGNVEIGTSKREPDRYERVERLCKKLDADGLVGDVAQDDKEFIRGTMLAVWGFHLRSTEGYADVVFFTAYPDDRTLLGLGGSAYHTMERSAERMQKYSNSGIGGLMGWLNERSADARGKHAYVLPGAWEHEIGDTDFDDDALPEEIEFVAQRLLVKREGVFRWILGSPIYVARTGRPATNEMLETYNALRELYAEAHYKRPRESLLNGRRYVGKGYNPELPPATDPEGEFVTRE